MTKIIMIFALLFTTNIFALDFMQTYVLKTAYKVGLQTKTKDGEHFAKTLSSVALQESSGGKVLVGDKYEDKYFYIHYEEGIRNKVYVTKANTYIKNKKRYYKYKLKYTKKIYKEVGELKSLYNSSLGAFQIKPSTAEIMIKRYFYKKYKNLLTDKNLLVQKLLSDVEFGAKIAASYLKHNYNYGLKIHKKNPYFLTVSRYNGGNVNHKYYNNIMKRMRYLERIKFFSAEKGTNLK